MLLNRTLERARAWTLEQRLLGRRARARVERPPLVIVPPVLGTRLVDGGGRTLWGATARVFFGQPVDEAEDVRPDGVVEDLPLVPGLFVYDVMGGLLRFLERIGGYRRGEDLFVADYDWRLGVTHAAARVAEKIQRIRGAGDERIDLLGVSSGGAIARYYLAYGDADAVMDDRCEPTGAGSACVRRVVYVGAPQRGSPSTLDRLHEGVVMAPLGKRFTEVTSLQTSYDFLPHPDDPLFVDDRGRALPIDLYDPGVWERYGLPVRPVPDLADRLGRARRLHRALDRAGGHPDTTVIAARHMATPARVVVEHGRVRFPACAPERDDPLVGTLYVPGDGSIPESSARALPGLDEARFWPVRPREHHRLPADPEVHRLVVEALVGSDARAQSSARWALRDPAGGRAGGREMTQ